MDVLKIRKDAQSPWQDILALIGPEGPQGKEGPQGPAGTTLYADLTDKPKINNVELSGNKTTSQLNLHTKDLVNDSGFITNTVANLTNYYPKGQTYTQEEINQMIAAIKTIQLQIVTELPAKGSSNIIYLIAKAGKNKDFYNEYLWVSNKFELIGSTEVDLSGYYTSAKTDELLNKKVDKINGKGLSTNDYTTVEKEKLKGIAEGAEVNVQSDWNSVSGDSFIKNKPTIPTTTKELTNNSGFITSASDITGNAATATNATSADKTKGTLTIQKNGKNVNTFNGSQNITANIEVPTVVNNLTSTSTTEALSASQGKALNEAKVDKISGKGLSTNDYTTAEKEKLKGIAAGAEVNVQSDWNASSGDAFIKNKPTIPTNNNQLTNGAGYITSSGSITGNAATATSADKTKGTLTIRRNGADVDTFDGSSDKIVNIVVPAKTGVVNNLTSTSTTAALSANQGKLLNETKVDKINGKGLSTNDFNNTYKNKLDGIAEGAEVNVQSDWNAVSGDSAILNKPTIPPAVYLSKAEPINIKQNDIWIVVD